ncbi:TauD/TfdA family dioxygenase [Archangium sp.]|uniref:TauD/TfdA dioxygenase family protein n=1 Tax=Archangium sp. TaxID=1872627 RepID=UPI002D728D55|nr:TauD/TfdA family dioxygenase [Archangium sp.]HYO56253.1 TauD/TfdA family dioxygenase [Archangium sp.]
MNLTTKPLTEHFGAEILDLDVRKAQDLGGEILRLLLEHQVLVIRNQELSARDFVDFARSLGTIKPFLLSNYHHPEFKEILITSNEKVDGKPLGVARVGNFWHSDSSYIKDPANTTMLYGIKVPPTGGDTLFASTYRAWDELDGGLKVKLHNKMAVHTIRKRYKVTAADVGFSLREIDDQLKVKVPDVEHPVVRPHPLTGRPALYVSEGYTLKINGLDAQENADMLEYLHEYMTSKDKVYAHKWRVGDILLWDNPSLIHAAGPTDPNIPRTMFRITVE